MGVRSWSVRDWCDGYVVTTELAPPPGFERVELREVGAARAFLGRVCGHDAGALDGLRRLAADEQGAPPRVRHQRGDVLEHLARALSAGALHVFRRERPFFVDFGVVERERPDALAPTDFTAEATHFFSVRVVDDETDAPIVGCRLEVKLPDCSTRALVTGPGGVAEILGAPEGSYELGSPFGAGTLDLTLVPAEGARRGAGSGGKDGAGSKPAAPKEAVAGIAYTIAEVKTHRVKSGETLASIARENGLTGAQLAYFNFGEYEGPALEEALRDRVGCTRKAEDGRFVLDDSDEPGVLHLPSRWSKRGLEVDRKHTLRVKPAAPPLPDVRLLYQFDPNEPGADNDTLTLETEDGSWSHELTVSDAPRPYVGWAALVFPAPPAGKRFNLIQDPKDGHDAFYAFRGVSYGDLREALAEQVEAERAEQERDQAGSGPSKEA